MRQDIAGQYVRYSDLAEARAEVERLKDKCSQYVEKAYDKTIEVNNLKAEIERLIKGRDEATSTVELVNSNNLTLAAELAGWKQAARQMEAERDEALAQVAAAYETASKAQPTYTLKDPDDAYGVNDVVYVSQLAIRTLTPADAKAALEAYGREKVREGMKRAAEIIRGCCPECHGTGLRDSGGVQPWGAPITVPCDCADAVLAGMETIV